METLSKTDIAALCHEINRSYNIAMKREDIGRWEDLPKDVKASIVSGVESVLNNGNVTAERQHKMWIQYKKENGWIWGKELDNTLRTHPYMIPFDKLPQESKVRIDLMISSVKALIPMMSTIGS